MIKPVRFSTDTADYCLDYGVHDKETKIEDIEQFDAIVLETGVGDYDYWNLRFFYNSSQYSTIIEENVMLDEPVPIFYVDIPSRKWIMEKGGEDGRTLSTLFELSSSAIFVLPFISLCLSHFCGYNKIYDQITGRLNLSSFYTPLRGFRSSASARKIEEFVAPEISERIRRKPNIFISFGKGHCEIEQYLTHKELRDFVTKFHEKLKIGSILCDYDYLDKVCELRPKNSSFEPYANLKIISRKDDALSARWEKILYEM